MLPLLLLVPISQWYQDIWCQKQNLCEVQVLSPRLKLPGGAWSRLLGTMWVVSARQDTKQCEGHGVSRAGVCAWRVCVCKAWLMQACGGSQGQEGWSACVSACVCVYVCVL